MDFHEISNVGESKPQVVSLVASHVVYHVFCFKPECKIQDSRIFKILTYVFN